MPLPRIISVSLLAISFAGTAALAYYSNPQTRNAEIETNTTLTAPSDYALPPYETLVARASAGTDANVVHTFASTETPTSMTLPVQTSNFTVVTTEQPPATLLLQGALGVPLTTFTLKAGNEDAVVTNITVLLSGFADKNVFESISIADDSDQDFDDEKTFRSDRTAEFKDSLTIPAHREKTFTVYGNLSEELADYDGQMPMVAIQSVVASSDIDGEFPIRGAMHTVNSSLRLGSATTQLSQFDPSVSKTHYINDTEVRFAGIRITAGTGEDLRFEGITFEQSGTAGPLDVANVFIVVDGVSYRAEVDEREYSVTFDAPIRIEKGRTVDVHIKGDITTTGANRTLVFEVGAPDDIVLVGEQYGFQTGDITPEGNTATSGGSVFITTDGTTEGDVGDPFFAGSEISISGGAFTSVGKN